MMNQLIRLWRILAVSICAASFLGLTDNIQAQVIEWIGGPVGTFDCTNAGGITYFHHINSGIGNLNLGPVEKQIDNSLAQSFSLTQDGEIFLGPNLFEGVSVLGALPPGTNFFYVDYLNSVPFLGGTVDRFGFRFVVPTNNTPTLKLAGVTNGLFQFTVNGIQGVRYTVQASGDMTNWVSIATNSGAPFGFTESYAGISTNRFYRTLIEAEPLVVSHDPNTPW